jgi:hypothetical protein
MADPPLDDARRLYRESSTGMDGEYPNLDRILKVAIRPDGVAPRSGSRAPADARSTGRRAPRAGARRTSARARRAAAARASTARAGARGDTMDWARQAVAARVGAVAPRAPGSRTRGQVLGGRVVRSSSVRMKGAGRVGWLAAPSTRTLPSKVTTPVAVASRCLRLLVLIWKPPFDVVWTLVSSPPWPVHATSKDT